MSRNRIAKKSKNEILIFEEKGQPFTTSLDIAEKFEKRHEYVVKKIERIGELDGFTAQTFLLSEYVDSTGRVAKMYNITRDGFAFLAMGFTGRKADEWKVKYIRAFNKLIEVIQNSKTANQENLNDPNWKPQRIESKVVRLDLTDALKKLAIYAKAQGSESPNMCYTNYSRLVNRLFEFNDYVKAQKNKRDYMSIKQLAELSNIENKLTDIIYNGMQDELYYKDIYLVCKEKIDKYIELFGTTPVIYNIPIERTEYTLLN